MELEYALDETGHHAFLMQGPAPAGILEMTIVPWRGLSTRVGGELDTARGHTNTFIIDHFLVRVHPATVFHCQVRSGQKLSHPAIVATSPRCT
jgi:hypothetical protein